MFHDIAPTYDFLNHLLSLNIDKRWRRFAARQLIGPDVQRVLDVCSGTGDLVLALADQARRVGAAPLLVSTDFTQRMCELALPKFRTASAVVIQPPAVADTMRLPFREGSFDIVSVAFGIRNVANLEAGLHEMVRVCRPGGRVAVLEFSHPRSAAFRALYEFYFFRVLPLIGRTLTGTRAYSYLPKSVSKFPDTREFTGLLSRISSGQVVAHRLTGGIATLYIAQKPST